MNKHSLDSGKMLSGAKKNRQLLVATKEIHSFNLLRIKPGQKLFFKSKITTTVSTVIERHSQLERHFE